MRINALNEIRANGFALVTRRAIFAVACSAAVVACGGSGQPAADASSETSSVIGQVAPDAEFAALQGKDTIKLSSLRGKVVLLDFWASWCAPCQEELPLLDDLAVRLKGKDIEIIGVSLDENKEDAEKFLKRKSSWALTLGHDPEQTVADQFKPPKMPTSYVIDSKGVVRHMNAGFERSDAKKIEDQLLELASAN